MMRTGQIHYIADHIRCCGAGTAADTEFVTNLISSNIEVSHINPPIPIPPTYLARTPPTPAYATSAICHPITAARLVDRP